MKHKKNCKNNNNKGVLFSVMMIVIGLIFGFILAPINTNSMNNMNSMSEGELRTNYLSYKAELKTGLLASGNYKCCLKESCNECLEDEEGCTCMANILNLKHPCGECIGEILEGHGNKFLTKYFASSIAEEVGMEHLDELKEIIKEKYGIPIEDQL